MTRITEGSLADVEFELSWKSDVGDHREHYLARNVNFWRDLLPGEVYQALIGSSEGGRFDFTFPPGDVTPPYESRQIISLPQARFDQRKINGRLLEPRYGRFYPKGVLKGLAGIYKDNVEPFRCVGLDGPDLTANLNHPLAGQEVRLGVTVKKIREKPLDRGGRLTDWMEQIVGGPGMQVRSNGQPTDFFSDQPFVRDDERHDTAFYEKPRLVTHIDDQARALIGGLYGRLLKPHSKVLDLMSSWRSHVPESLALSSLTGLGLNSQEMESNPQLTDHVIHDLNRDPTLPFEDNRFDAVICTVSVEYLIRPFDVFKDVARVLKPGGIFAHTFSNRWFPPKAITLWTELSEFERMGLVTEYFLQTGDYDDLETASFRGWPRPDTDRYYMENPVSDPVYAVWGRRAG